MIPRRTFATLFLGLSLAEAFSNQNLIASYSRDGTGLRAKIAKYLDDGNYNDVMLGEDKVVLVDACAPWCGPCKLIEPFLEQAAVKYADDIDIVKLDVEAKDNGSVKVEFLLQGVMPQALPSLIVFRNGEHIATHQGALTSIKLDQFIEDSVRKAQDSRKAQERELLEVESASSKKGFISFGGMRDDYAL